MPDAIADIPEPQAEKKLGTLSSGVPTQEAQEAIRKAFPYEGDLRVRLVCRGSGIEKYRVNWFGQVDGQMRVVKSLFLSVMRTEAGLVVQNETAMRGC